MPTLAVPSPLPPPAGKAAASAAPNPSSTAPRPALPLTSSHDTLGPNERRALVGGIAGLHLLALWGLLQVGAVQQAVREVAPLVVDFISIEPPRPLPAPPPPPPVPQPRVQRSAPPPLPVIAAPPSAEPAPAPFVVPPPPPQPVVAAPVVAAAPAPVAPAAPPAPPAAPPAPKAVPASALRYTVAPPIEVPMASRRLQESGTVWLRVVFDASGRPRQVLLHKSSGFARLDEQAQQAMRQARITPYLDNGTPVDITVTAPLQYDIE